jgi:hypothetical protein
LHSILIGVVLAAVASALAAVASALTVKSRWERFWREELAAWDQLPFPSKSAAHFPARDATNGAR